jgi:hypothetical protein
MLAAVAATCPLSGRSVDQENLLRLIATVTEPRRAVRKSFCVFLAEAQEVFTAGAEIQILDDAVRSGAVAAIAACSGVDLIGQVYERLVALVNELYAPVLGESLEPGLEVKAVARSKHKFHISGVVPPSRATVQLVLSSGFDLTSLALVPRVIAHELVCHIGARDTGGWTRESQREVQFYFSDGMMDRTAELLLSEWIQAGELSGMAIAGHLAEAQVPWAYTRPQAFDAGRAAHANCVAAVHQRLRAADRVPGGAALERTITGALALNASACGLPAKDRFADQARYPETAAPAEFADVAVDGTSPLLVLRRYTPPSSALRE